MKPKLFVFWPMLVLTLGFITSDQGFAYYDPGVQRWINRDPINERGGGNLYKCVSNDPIRRVDLTGLAPDVPDGSEQIVADCWCAYRVAKKTQQKLRDKGVQIGNDFTGENAYQHCLIACEAGRACGVDSTRKVLTAYEQSETPERQTHLQQTMDLSNNEVGLGIKGDCSKGCADAWRNGKLTCINFATRKTYPCPGNTLPENL